MSAREPRGEPLEVVQLEDSPDDAEILQHGLSEAGFSPRATVVHDRAGFLGALARQPDIVIADYQLPDITGLEALRVARDRWPDLPFIVVTGAVGEEKTAECMREGADDILMKDRLARLGPVVRRALEDRRLRREHAAMVERLRESDDRFRQLIAASPLPIVTLDPEGIVESWNPAAEKVFGWTAGEAVGRLLPFVAPAHGGEFAALRGRILAGEALDGVEISRTRSNGSPIDLALYAAPLHDAAGGVTGIVALLEDITERRRREKAWRELSAAMEHAHETVVITGADRVITWVNPRFEAVTGWSRVEVLGRTPETLRGDGLDGAMSAALESTLASGAPWHGRIVNRRRDGTLYHEEKTVAPIPGPGGTLAGYVDIGRDVTQEVELEANLRQAQKMEAVGRLAGGVAHDFNNMLQVIGGYLELLATREKEPLSPFLGEIRRATERAAHLTHQLLAFSRRQDLRLRPLDVNDLVANLLKMIRRLIGEDIRLSFQPGTALPAVNADAGQLEQVILNLCINARDAMPSGGDLQIETAAARLDAAFVAARPGSFAGASVVLSVADTGTGMDEEVRARLFEPYFTTKAEGHGTGLGLPMVYGIVKQHGGYLDFDSAPGRGTTFRVYLPALAIGAVAVPTETSPPIDTAPRGSETVLVAEDETSIRELSVLVLGDAGYRVLAAADGVEALEVFRAHRGEIALAVLDAVMPRLNGIDTLRRMREEGAAFPVLFASGYTAGTVQQQLEREPGTELLVKPFPLHDLLAQVRAMIDRSLTGEADRP